MNFIHGHVDHIVYYTLYVIGAQGSSMLSSDERATICWTFFRADKSCPTIYFIIITVKYTHRPCPSPVFGPSAVAVIIIIAHCLHGPRYTVVLSYIIIISSAVYFSAYRVSLHTIRSPNIL